MDLDKLYEIITETSCQLRKGEAVVHEQDEGKVPVTHVYAMPHVLEFPVDGTETVDAHFIMVGVHRAKAEQRKAELIEILKTYPHPERLAGGPSYIDVGAVVGDQGAALQLFGLGHVLGLWKVVTPATFGLTGAEADKLAGMGMVMISGWKP